MFCSWSCIFFFIVLSLSFISSSSSYSGSKSRSYAFFSTFLYVSISFFSTASFFLRLSVSPLFSDGAARNSCRSFEINRCFITNVSSLEMLSARDVHYCGFLSLLLHLYALSLPLNLFFLRIPFHISHKKSVSFASHKGK